ncbi:MAG: tetratricopeptide repeat protein [Proteobacteria bacterium]|nr:tetratricopeptide repeat protein [Pseudomonadota bacterium]
MSGKQRKTPPPPPGKTKKAILPAPHSTRNGSIMFLLLFLVVTAVMYGNSLNNTFVFDDIPLIVENSLIRDFRNIPMIMGLENGQPMYRPVRYLSYMIDYAISGMNPVAYHGANCLYHALTAFILFLLLRTLTGSRLTACAGAVLFLVHPVATDSVTYISGRRDILVTLFYLLAFYCFVGYRKSQKPWYAAATVLCFILALGSKEMGVTLPVVCFLYDFTCAFAGMQNQPASLAHKIKQSLLNMVASHGKLYAAIGAAGALFFYYKIFVHYPSLMNSFYGGTAQSNFATVIRIVCYYIKLLLLPVALHADYSYNSFPLSRSFAEPRVIASLLVLAGCLRLIIWSLNRQRWVFLGGMWFFVTLLPVCQIFPHHELMAEHYLYLPAIGFIILLTPLLQYLMENKNKAALVLFAVLLLALSARTIARNRDWRDPMTLWSTVLKRAPQCARAHDNLGTEYFKRKEYPTALMHYKQAVQIRPEHAIFHNNLGRAYGVVGDIQNAQAELEQAVALNPGLAEAYNNLGIAYYQKGDYRKAAELFWKSGSMKPSELVSFNYARSMLQLGVVAEAVRALEEAVHLKPDYVDAYQELGAIFLKKGDRQRCVAYLEKALQAAQDLSQKERIEKAIEYIRKNG